MHLPLLPRVRIYAPRQNRAPKIGPEGQDAARRRRSPHAYAYPYGEGQRGASSGPPYAYAYTGQSHAHAYPKACQAYSGHAYA